VAASLRREKRVAPSLPQEPRKKAKEHLQLMDVYEREPEFRADTRWLEQTKV
jgi:hypothetical protein